MKASSITNLLFNQLSFRSRRQSIISSNIANINTPNYKTKDLIFKSELKKIQEYSNLKLVTTNDKHIASTFHANLASNTKIVDIKGLQEQNDGNNVNLDMQISEMSKNKVIFDAIQSSIKKDALLFRFVIESSAKN